MTHLLTGSIMANSTQKMFKHQLLQTLLPDLASAISVAVIHSDLTTSHSNAPMAVYTLDSVTSHRDASTAATGDEA